MDNWSPVKHFKTQHIVWKQKGHTCSISSPDLKLHWYKVCPQKRVCMCVQWPKWKRNFWHVNNNLSSALSNIDPLSYRSLADYWIHIISNSFWKLFGKQIWKLLTHSWVRKNGKYTCCACSLPPPPSAPLFLGHCRFITSQYSQMMFS